MKQFAITTVLFSSLISCQVMANDSLILEPKEPLSNIHIVRSQTQSITQGSPNNFTGSVSVKRLFPSDDPLNLSGGYVTFEPGARTAWHSHPNGQLLIITQGSGLVQQWDGPVIEVHEGDVVWFPADIKHWHGAKPDQSMTHIALAPIVEGKSANWMELVSEEQYPN